MLITNLNHMRYRG